ncbi:MAG: DUF502 domain-containing protein [Calditrichaceae bacterium]
MKKLLSHFKNYILAGIVVVVPLAITIIVLKNLFIYLDEIARPYLEPWLGFWPIGMGLLITIVLIFFIGLLTNNIVVKRLVGFGENILLKIPIAKLIYSAVKQLLETFSASDKQYFQRVVAVEYPSKDIWSIGFVNGESFLPGQVEKKINILILTSINPASGFFIMVPKNKTIPLNISVEEGMKWVISGGIIKPEVFKKVEKTD